MVVRAHVQNSRRERFTKSKKVAAFATSNKGLRRDASSHRNLITGDTLKTPSKKAFKLRAVKSAKPVLQKI